MKHYTTEGEKKQGKNITKKEKDRKMLIFPGTNQDFKFYFGKVSIYKC